ncbi:AraC family transcriptional regulator [Chitinophaga sp. Cy-1792]|uniref:helix-turn-helix transcriptional regulator n=1 Tax=Chitinophaga sp. Cy-1792 TaxID=2608339 RepID=UPI00142403FE|nr:AraC family transcriptional regulator [Chitinophaga sp. Cy-1792]NIG55857.1 helix-turn-helix transcriptional regulator [Chitinophaga sp. Cy-1792]
MKLSIVDTGSGITREFARAIGATVEGRFIYIPASKGSGYITGFSWGRDLRMMIRYYHLKKDVIIERTNKLAEGQEDMVFLLSGVFPALKQQDRSLMPETASIMICRHAVSSVLAMPANTIFGSITIAISREQLHQMFGSISHPIVSDLLTAGENFIMETGMTSQIIKTAGEMLAQPIPVEMESHFYRLKCEELLCYVVAMLMQREEVPSGSIHMDDIKAIYAIKDHLLRHLDTSPQIAELAREAGMSEPKLRKIFKQIFGKGVFEYYQSARMNEAAILLKEKKMNVSEVGYHLGFTNLSHFSRVFEKHIGIKPKKYAASPVS